MKTRLKAYLVSALWLGAALAPAFGDASDDSFPLSTYPMFAHARARTEAVTSAVAVNADGSESVVPARYVANSEPIQALSTLVQTVEQGKHATNELCRAIAQRLLAANDRRFAQAQRVLIVTRSVDAIEFLAGRAKPGGGKVHAHCKLHREAAP